MNCERVCIIPARGGSKGLPGKNLMRIGDETLVRAAVRKAIEADTFDTVVLSSDDEEILAEGAIPGVTCLRRSESASTDAATSEMVLLEVLDQLEVYAGVLSLMQCTTPMLSVHDIVCCVNMQAATEKGTVIAGYTQSVHHWIIRSDGRMRPIGSSGQLRRPRQSSGERIFIENGGIYVTDVAAFRRSGSRFNNTIVPYEMEEERSIDIDSEWDLQRAVYSYRVRFGTDPGTRPVR